MIEPLLGIVIENFMSFIARLPGLYLLRRTLFVVGLIVLGGVLSVSAQGVFNVRNYGAIGDGVALDTSAIQSAINAASAAGGGQVYLPPGTYKTISLYLDDNVTLNITNGAKIQASLTSSDWDSRPYGPVIVGSFLNNIGIIGSGTIDGGGMVYYSNGYVVTNSRPQDIIRIKQCTNVTISGILCTNSTKFTIELIQCEYVTIDGVTIRNREYVLNRETDGIDVSGRYILVKNCDIETGDDGICLKPQTGIVTHDVTIQNCTVASTCNATKIGTGTTDEAYNIVFDRITVRKHSRVTSGSNPIPSGACIAAISMQCNDGGTNHNFTFQNYVITNCDTPIFIEAQNRQTLVAHTNNSLLYGLTFSNIFCFQSGRASQINVQKPCSIQDVTFNNITIHNQETTFTTASPPYLSGGYPDAENYGRMPAYGLFARYVTNLTFIGAINFYDDGNSGRPVTVFENVSNVIYLVSNTTSATYYWDGNGATAGFGMNATGTWGASAFWSTNSAGATTPSNPATTTSDNLFFGIDTMGITNGGTITGPSTAQGFGAMTFGAASGAITISGGTLTTASPSIITVNNASDTISVKLTSGLTSGSLVKSGNGALTLTGTNTYTGATTVSIGTLVIGGAGTLGGGAYNAPIINNTAFIYGSSSPQTLSGVISGTGSLAKTNTGILTLSGANTYSGGTTVSGGVLQVNGDGQLGIAPGSPDVNLTLNGGQLFNNGNSGTYAVTLAANRGISLGTGGGCLQAGWATSGGSLAVNGAISGAGGLGVVWDGGVVILSGTGSYSGSTTIGTYGNNYYNNSAANPTLQLGNASALPGTDLIFGTSAQNNTATLDLHGFSATVASLSGSSNATIDNKSGTDTCTLTIGINNASNGTFSGVIKNTSGTVALTKIGTGTATLSGANTYSGGTTFTNGYLTAGNNTAFGTGAVTISGSANRLTINDGLTVTNDITINASTGVAVRGLIENSGTGNATLSGGTITINGATSNGGHFGNANGSGSLTINEAINASVGIGHRLGTVIYGGGGSYANLAVRQGTARLGAYNGLSTSATVDLALSGTTALDLAGYNQTLAGITKVTAGNTGYITNSSATTDSTLMTTGTSSYAGTIVDGSARKVALTANGGSLTLAGTNTYSGATTVSNGTLLVNGAIGNSAVTVAGGTLGGSGLIRGAVTVQSGGTLSPGASIGTLTISNRLTLAGTTLMEINSTNGQSDLVQGVTNLTYGGSLMVSNVAGIQPTNGQTFQLFSVPATFSGNFSSITPALTGGQSWSFNPTNGVLSLVASVNTNPTNLTFTVTSGTMNLSWPADHTGWRLLVQTNNLAAGLSLNTNDWMTVPGSSATNQLSLPIDPAKPTEFYRLVYP